MRKTNLTFVLGFLFILASAMMVSAEFNIGFPGSVNHNDGSFNVGFTTDIVENHNIFVDYGASVPTVLTDNGTFVVSFNDSMSFGSITGYVTNGSMNKTFSVNIDYDFCGTMPSSQLNIVDYEINNLGRGDDEEWEYLDEVEIEVEIDNPSSNDIDDVNVEIKVFDSDGNDVTNDFDFDDEKIDLGRVKDDDSEIATFKIDKVKVEDLEKGDYRIYVRVYSDDDNKCDAEIDGEKYIPFEIKSDLEDDFLVDESEEVLASCGDSGVAVTFDVWNLGSDKEDKVLVNLYSSALNIDEYAVIDDIRAGKEESVSFIFDMPDYASSSYYNLDVLLFYDYDEDDGDEFDEFAYDDEVEDSFQVILRVDNCNAPEPTVGVSTDDEIRNGDEFSFEVSVTNNAPNTQSIIVSLSDVDSWAEGVTIEPGILVLEGGETDTVTITMSATDAGSHTFSVKTTVGTQTYSQPVSVDVKSKFALGKYFSMDYWEYWAAIGLIVLILIVLIVIIAVVRR
jgi:hypothetical protein